MEGRIRIKDDFGVDSLAFSIILHTLRTIDSGWIIHQGVQGSQLNWLQDLIPWTENLDNVFISYYSTRYNIDESRIRDKIIEKTQKRILEVRDEIKRSKQRKQLMKQFKAMYKFDEAVEEEKKEEETVEVPVEEAPAEE